MVEGVCDRVQRDEQGKGGSMEHQQRLAALSAFEVRQTNAVDGSSHWGQASKVPLCPTPVCVLVCLC